MRWTEIPAGLVNAAQQRLLVALGDDASEVVACINNGDPELLQQLAFFARISSLKPDKKELANPDSQPLYTKGVTEWLRVRKIMGPNFFGVEEAVRCFGVRPSRAQLDALAEIPFTDTVLKSCMDTHVLAAVFPLSIIEIRNRVPHNFFFTYSNPLYNYDNEAFTNDRGEVSWQLVCKKPVAESMDKSWGQQRALLTDFEVTPSARVVIYTIVGHKLANGELLFEKVNVRCSDTTSENKHVTVGSSNLLVGLFIECVMNDTAKDSFLGLASARLPAKAQAEAGKS